MKRYFYLATVAVALTHGTWASSPENNEEKPAIEHTVSLPGCPTIPAHCVGMISPTPHMACLNLPPEMMGALSERHLLDAIAKQTGNPDEFMNHHAMSISTLPLDTLCDALRRKEFSSTLKKSSLPCATRYYDVERRVVGTRLSLKGLGLVFLPPVLWTHTELTELSLDVNRIKYLPEGIGELVNLKQLTLCNFFAPLPQAFVKLTKLERIYMSPEQWDYFQDQPVLYDLQNAQRALGNRPVTVWILYENGDAYKAL